MNEKDELPIGWCWTTLGEIAAKSMNGYGKRRSVGGAPSIVLRLADIHDGIISLESTRRIGATSEEVEKYALACDDLLAIRVNGSPDLVGRLVRFTTADEPVLFCDHFIRIRLAEPEFARLLRYFADTGAVRHFVERNKVSSAGQNTISQGTLDQLSIPLAPRLEQQRIIAKLEELFSDLDAGVAALKRAKANLKRYRAAVLKAAVEGKLTEEWRAKHPNTEPASKLLDRILTERRQKWEGDQLAKFAAAGKEPPMNWRDKYVDPSPSDMTGLPELPKGWCWAKLDQLLSYLRNGYFQSPSGAESGTPILRINAVRPMKVDLSEKRYLDDIEGSVDDYFIENGDLLFTRYNGSLDLLGVAGMVRHCTENMLHPDKLIRVKLVLGDPLPSFIEVAANVGASRKHMAGRARTTAGQTGISGPDVREMPIPLPPLTEQLQMVREVAEKLSLIETAEVSIAQNLLRADRLRQSILKQAFEGKLVPQDPAEEPAAELLSRIRQQSRSAVRKVAIPSLSTKRPRIDKVNLGRAIAYCLTRRKKPHGRTWLAKVLVLGELHVGVPLNLRPNRFPHGPLDDMIFDAERMAKKAGWFNFEKAMKPKEPTRYEVTSGTAVEAAKFMELLGDRKAAFDNLIKNFDSLDSDGAELFGTVYTAWNDLLIDGRSADHEAIIAEFYAWDDSKANFTRNQILNQIAWLRQHDYVPTGKGPRTIVLDQNPEPLSKPAKKPRKA